MISVETIPGMRGGGIKENGRGVNSSIKVFFFFLRQGLTT
jgi:hypothetical protein